MPSAADRWSPIVARATASELSLREFARREGVNPSTLAWWRWKLGRAKPRPAFVEVVVGELEEQVRESLTVRVGAARIDVDFGTDLELLRRVVEVLS